MISSKILVDDLEVAIEWLRSYEDEDDAGEDATGIRLARVARYLQAEVDRRYVKHAKRLKASMEKTRKAKTATVAGGRVERLRIWIDRETVLRWMKEKTHLRRLERMVEAR